MIRTFNVKIDYTSVKRALKDVEKGITNKAIRAHIADDLLKWIDKNFETQGKMTYPTAGWAKLSKKYAARKLKLVGAKGILQLTDEMRNSFKVKLEGHMGGNSKIIVTNPTAHAPHHEFGARRSNLPQRKMLPFNFQIKELSERLTNQFVQAVVNRNKNI